MSDQDPNPPIVSRPTPKGVVYCGCPKQKAEKTAK